MDGYCKYLTYYYGVNIKQGYQYLRYFPLVDVAWVNVNSFSYNGNVISLLESFGISTYSSIDYSSDSHTTNTYSNMYWVQGMGSSLIYFSLLLIPKSNI